MKNHKYFERISLPAFIPESRKSYWEHAEITFDLPNPLVSNYFKAKLDLELAVKNMEKYLASTGQITVTPYV